MDNILFCRYWILTIDYKWNHRQGHSWRALSSMNQGICGWGLTALDLSSTNGKPSNSALESAFHVLVTVAMQVILLFHTELKYSYLLTTWDYFNSWYVWTQGLRQWHILMLQFFIKDVLCFPSNISCRGKHYQHELNIIKNGQNIRIYLSVAVQF